ncbi:MAG TPA: hypothetical protein EYQ00_05330 [Dehalococcoidia bacterium]|jgi:hypothetical protein|nr:hypothetical protein [Dehalococcoidia bacterium]
MKLGDLVERKNPMVGDVRQIGCHGVGLILWVGPGGMNPVHPCAAVFWFDRGKVYDIAQSLIRVVDA